MYIFSNESLRSLAMYFSTTECSMDNRGYTTCLQTECEINRFIKSVTEREFPDDDRRIRSHGDISLGFHSQVLLIISEMMNQHLPGV